MTQPPKPTEVVYMPRSSVHPALFAFGLAALIVGLFSWWPYAVIGGAIALFSLIGWLRSNRAEIARIRHPSRSPALGRPSSPKLRRRHGRGRSDLRPAAHDVAHREHADELSALDDDQVADASLHHLLGRLLEAPGRFRGDHALAHVIRDLLGVGVLPRPHSVEDVSLGDDPRARRLIVEDQGRAGALLGHLGRGLPQGVARSDPQDHARHPLANLHPRRLRKLLVPFGASL